MGGLVGGAIFVTLGGDVPSKKNSRRLVFRGARPLSLPSQAYESWHEAQVWELNAVRFGNVPLKVSGISADLYPSTLRSADCSNKLESILDLLVDTAIIADDNWHEVPVVCAAFNGVDRENPRAEVTIFYA